MGYKETPKFSDCKAHKEKKEALWGLLKLEYVDQFELVREGTPIQLV